MAEALDEISRQTQQLGKLMNVNPSGETLPPGPIASLSVTGADGFFDLAIMDTSPVSQNINYFFDYSLTPSFASPSTVHLGPARNWRGGLGNITLYFRAYSQYTNSTYSVPVYFGPVSGGGLLSGPALHSGQGSGATVDSGGNPAAGGPSNVGFGGGGFYQLDLLVGGGGRQLADD